MDVYPTDDYAAIGRFVVAFEGVAAQLRNGIAIVLNNHGLADVDLYDAITAELEVRQLVRMYQTFAVEQLKKSDDVEGNKEFLEIVSQSLNAVERMQKKRNDVAHGYWEPSTITFTGFEKTTTEYMPTRGIRIQHVKTGLRRKELPDAAKLRDWISEADLLEHRLQKLNQVLINYDHPDGITSVMDYLQLN